MNCVFSAVCSLVGVTIWGIKIPGNDSVGSTLVLGWSYFLGVAHCILALIGGSVAFLAASKTEPQQQLLLPV